MRIRPVELGDLSELVRLCIEHARYERADIGAGPNELALRAALFASPPRLHAWVAVRDQNELIGFASATLDYSTWSACELMHMDCLFVREHARGRGIGRSLVDAVIVKARELSVTQIQWQTPKWNRDAHRFYERLSARSQDKVRFTLVL